MLPANAVSIRTIRSGLRPHCITQRKNDLLAWPFFIFLSFLFCFLVSLTHLLDRADGGGQDLQGVPEGDVRLSAEPKEMQKVQIAQITSAP